MRLNLGSGLNPLDGFTNVDLYCPADISADFRERYFQGVEEVVMCHVLEHLPHGDVHPTLVNIRSWMLPDAPITVEVPDIQAIFENPRASWLTDVYGTQSSPGEYHQCGFMQNTLGHALWQAGFRNVDVRRFISEHPFRQGMPCLEATGVA